jgi:hypothetical protein
VPRGRLNEKHVQQVAVHWLTCHYKCKFGVQSVVPETEVVVRAKNKLGAGRADGLVVSLLPDGTVFTAALEAKSARTLLNISPWYDDERWVIHVLIAGILGLLPAGIVGWLLDTWFWMLILPSLGFFGASFAYMLLTKEHSRYRPIDVVQQVKRYPADEQWIAVSADAYNLLTAEWQGALRAACRKYGIGLLIVRSAIKISSLEIPRLRKVPRGHIDFLSCYSRAESVRQKLRLLVHKYESQSDTKS